MREEKFFLGEWQALTGGDGEPMVVCNGHAIVYACVDGFTEKSQIPNTHLIAAAPDLYWTLKALVQFVDDNGDDLDQWAMAELIAGAREALSKARGGE
jgi:hypothetical protein